MNNWKNCKAPFSCIEAKTLWDVDWNWDIQDQSIAYWLSRGLNEHLYVAAQRVQYKHDLMKEISELWECLGTPMDMAHDSFEIGVRHKFNSKMEELSEFINSGEEVYNNVFKF